MLGELYVCCKRGCLPLLLEGVVPPAAAGSTIEREGVDSPAARGYLTPEGGEAEARPMLLSRAVNGESPY